MRVKALFNVPGMSRSSRYRSCLRAYTSVDSDFEDDVDVEAVTLGSVWLWMQPAQWTL